MLTILAYFHVPWRCFSSTMSHVRWNVFHVRLKSFQLIIIMIIMTIIIIIIFIIGHKGANYAPTTHEEMMCVQSILGFNAEANKRTGTASKQVIMLKIWTSWKDNEIIHNWFCTVNTCLRVRARAAISGRLLQPEARRFSYILCRHMRVYPCPCPTWLFSATLSAKRGTSWLWNATNGSEALRWESMHWLQRIVPITLACTPSCALTSLSQCIHPPK